MKTLVIGLGNPILGDDGVGWRVADQVAACLNEFPGQPVPNHAVDVTCLAMGGLDVMEAMIGYDRAIIIDAILTHSQPLGAIQVQSLADLPNRAQGHIFSAHDTTLQNAISFGKQVGASLPSEIRLVTIEAHQVFDFSETLSSPIRAAIPAATQAVIDLLQLGGTSP